MNTINVYLKTSGSVAELDKDFAMFVGSYQNKLIDIFVPKSLLYSNQNGTYINAVKINATQTATNGTIVTTDTYNLDYLKDETISGVEYSVFERLLPKEFCVYAGDTTITTNVVNIDNTNSASPIVLDVVTTQTCVLTVQASQYISQETIVDPSVVDTLSGRIAVNTQNINSLDTRMTTAEGNITNNTSDIGTLQDEVAVLQRGTTIVGQISGTTDPNDITAMTPLLDAYVLQIESRTRDIGDIVKYVYTTSGQNYQYTFTSAGWVVQEITLDDPATNNSLGLVQGTYGTSTNNTQFDIVQGIIRDVYTKNNANNVTSTKNYLNTLETAQSNIISGATVVGNATNSVNDGVGNNIVDTYQTKTDGASKVYVKDYALPKLFNDVDFLTADGLENEVGNYTTSVNISSVGTINVFNTSVVAGATPYSFDLSYKNSVSLDTFVSSNVDTSLQFIVTAGLIVNGVNTPLAVITSEAISLVADEVKELKFASFLTSLAKDQVLHSDTEGNLTLSMQVFSTDITPRTLTIYSTSTYPTQFGLNVQGQTIKLQQGYLGEMPVFNLTGTLTNNIISFAVPSEVVINNNIWARFNLSFDGEFDNNTQMQLVFDDQAIRLITPYNYLSGVATTEDMLQVFIGGNWHFNGYITNDGTTIAVNVAMDNLEDQNALVQQVDFDAILSGNEVQCYLDSSLSDFNFENTGFYKGHIVLPLSFLTLDLPNSYVIKLYDKPITESTSANAIMINNIYHISGITSATVGQMCSLQNYDINTGIDWNFTFRYSQYVDNGTTYRVVYTADVVRESNTAMTGADLYTNITNNTLKTGTIVYCTSDYTNGTISYSAGTSYLITGQIVGGDLIIDTQALHDISKENISNKISVIDESVPSTSDYPNEFAVVNYANANFVSVNPQTLTAEQKAQVKENIGADSSNVVLYSTEGQNTDGAMTQKATTDKFTDIVTAVEQTISDVLIQVDTKLDKTAFSLSGTTLTITI